MQQEATESTSKTIIFARHIVGMAILALASPLIYHSSEPVGYWFASWMAPVAISAAVFGMYALFFTRHAKRSWPHSFFTLAWILVALSTAGPWMSKLRENRAAARSESSLPLATSSSKATDRQQADNEMMLEEYLDLLIAARLELRSAGIIQPEDLNDQLDRAISSYTEEAMQLGLEDRVGDIAASRYALNKGKFQILQKYGHSKSQPSSKKSAPKTLTTFEDLDAAGLGIGYKRPN